MRNKLFRVKMVFDNRMSLIFTAHDNGGKKHFLQFLSSNSNQGSPTSFLILKSFLTIKVTIDQF